MYPFATVHNQEKTLYRSHQNNLTNYQWYENLNTKSYVANSIELDRHHKVLMEHIDQEYHRDAFENITEEEQKSGRADSKEKVLIVHITAT